MRDKAVVRSWGLIGVGVALILMLVGCAVADEFDDAFAAFQRGDYEMAHGLFRPLAEQGDASAQGKLGSMFYEGQGVPQSSPKAERWFKMAAAQGLARAQNGLGEMYYRGQGVPQSYDKAERWYRKAAEHGITSAQNNLGIMYYQGRKVTQDYIEAHIWFNLAAATGDLRAIQLRGIVANKMTANQIVQAQKKAREWRQKYIDLELLGKQ